MTQENADARSNPAFELYDLIKPWAVTPTNTTGLRHRARTSGLAADEATTKALNLIADVKEYLEEKDQITG